MTRAAQVNPYFPSFPFPLLVMEAPLFALWGCGIPVAVTWWVICFVHFQSGMDIALIDHVCDGLEFHIPTDSPEAPRNSQRIAI